MKPRALDKADFISAIGLIGFAVAVVWESLRMDRLEGLNIHPYTVPGLVPGMLGGLLLFCGTILLIRSIRRGGWRISLQPGALSRLWRDQMVRRIGLTLLLTFGFALGLFGWLPFGFGAAVFIFAFILLLGPQMRLSDPGWPKQVAVAATISACAGYGIAAVFTEIFIVKLP